MKKTVLRMIAILMLVISTSLWLPYDNAQARNVSLKEGENTQTDSISKDNSIIYNLNQFKPPTGFSGVYNTKTQDLEVKPSVYVPKNLSVLNVSKKDGKEEYYDIADSVKNKGGHLEIENELIIKNLVKDNEIETKINEFQNNNVGFFFCLEEGKILKFNWISGKINKRNNERKDKDNKKSCAPDDLRKQIIEVINNKVKGDGYQVEGLTCREDQDYKKVEDQCLQENQQIDKLFVAEQAPRQ